MTREIVRNLICDIYGLISLAEKLEVHNIDSDIKVYGGIPPYYAMLGPHQFTPTEMTHFDIKRHALNLLFESIIDKYAPKENCGDADELTNALIRLNDEIQARNKELDGQQSLFEEEGEE